jgi:hypothetical protein
MPWWGWLITAVVALTALYYFVALVLVGTVFRKAGKTIDCALGNDKKDPFDDPWFKKDHFNDPFFRFWIDVREIRTTIADAYERSGPPGKRFLVVRHGKCPTGADRIASLIVYSYHREGIYTVVEDAMPAEWQHEGCTHPKGVIHPGDSVHGEGDWYCKAAGPIRNQAMIDKGGIDEFHAFPLSSGTGTQDCINRARKAGIEPVIHTQHLAAAVPQPHVPYLEDGMRAFGRGIS